MIIFFLLVTGQVLPSHHGTHHDMVSPFMGSELLVYSELVWFYLYYNPSFLLKSNIAEVGIEKIIKNSGGGWIINRWH